MKLVNKSIEYEKLNSQKLEEVLNTNFKQLFPPSLKQIIITPRNHEQYISIVHEYDCNAKISKGENHSGYAIYINLMNGDDFEQYIIIKDLAFLIAINTIFAEFSFKKVELLGYTTEFEELFTGCFFHEVGHSIDYFYRHKLYGEIPNIKKDYDLSNIQENNEFFKNAAAKLWSEFYAQFVSEECLKQNHLFYINELNRLIANPIKEINTNKDIIESLNYCYRIAYNLSLVTARLISSNKKITNIQLIQQLKFFIHDIDQSSIKYSLTLYDLYLHIDHWIFDTVKKYMANAYIELIQEFTEKKIDIIKFEIDEKKIFTKRNLNF
ncbi:MAG: hypothetical protein ACPKNR_11535 [Pleomorphochaeta sp.]